VRIGRELAGADDQIPPLRYRYGRDDDGRGFIYVTGFYGRVESRKIVVLISRGGW